MHRRHAAFPTFIATALCAALAASSASAQIQKSSRTGRAKLPTLTTDEIDYGPGQTAVLNGSGFVPNEFVTLHVVHADGTPSTGADHDPWIVASDEIGRFVTTWHVCEDDCVNSRLLATADGLSSGLRAKTTFTDSHVCGTGIVSSVTGVGGSCSAFTPAVGAGPDNYEVQQGGTYTMTITGVTECTGSTITVFIQSSSSGNFCFNATGGGGTYVGTFTLPSQTCNTMPISYKCGASAACSHPNSFAASGPHSGCGGVHLRSANFDGSCNKTGNDTDCGTPPPTGACCLTDGTCVEVSAADCATMGGTYNGDGSKCVNVSCPPPGACCLDRDTCVQVTEEECTEQGGVYHGDFSLCSNFDCADDFPPCVPYSLTFETDDEGNPMPHGAKVDTEFDGGSVFPVTITGYVHASGANTAAILNSTTGPAAVDPDLLVGKGNILILQNDANLNQCPPGSGVYCSHNDDEDGGQLTFVYNVPVTATSLVLIDIDEGDPTSFVILIDTNGLKRTYTVPHDWTGDQIEDGPPGYRMLSLTTLLPQLGFNSTATAVEEPGFDSGSVIEIDVIFGGSAGVDDVTWCQ